MRFLFFAIIFVEIVAKKKKEKEKEATIHHKNNETDNKFYRKVAFLCIGKWLILGLKAEKQLRN